jgi:hypothetical protein
MDIEITMCLFIWVLSLETAWLVVNAADNFISQYWG